MPTILLPGKYYHVFNRANGRESIFANQGNYAYFLRQYVNYINPIATTLCYCLMPNHFHLLIQIKDEGYEDKHDNYNSKQFSNLFSSYTLAFNRQQQRKGSLFMKNFKRKKIESEAYLRKVIHYIHFNPVEAGICKTPEQYKYSSFRALVSKAATHLAREEVLGYFEDLENFIHVHRNPPQETGIGQY